MIRNPKPLLPHQQEFIARFFDAREKGVFLRADVGLGTTLATAGLVAEFIRRNLAARVVIIMPMNLLTAQMASVLGDFDVNVDKIDRFRFRELESETTGNHIWRVGTVHLLGVDFAKKADVRQSLTSTQWDLIVFWEAHQLSDERSKLARALVVSSPTARVLAISVAGPKQPPDIGVPGWSEVRWEAAEVVQTSELKEVPDAVLHVIGHTLTDEERRVKDRINELLQQISRTEGGPDLYTPLFQKAVKSSPAALEEIIERLRSRVHDWGESLGIFGEQEDRESDADDIPGTIEDREAIAGAITSCAIALEEVDRDSKLEAFRAWLTGRSQAAGGKTRPLCILSEYRATHYYLQTALEEMELEALLLHGAMTDEERLRSIQMFRDNGGILLATNAALEGLDLISVADVVLYDLPQTVVGLYFACAPFQRFGRTSSLVVHVVAAAEEADEAVKRVAGALGGLATGQSVTAE